MFETHLNAKDNSCHIFYKSNLKYLFAHQPSQANNYAGPYFLSTHLKASFYLHWPSVQAIKRKDLNL